MAYPGSNLESLRKYTHLGEYSQPANVAELKPYCYEKIRDQMIRLLYSLVFYCFMPLVLLRLLYRSIRAPAYRQRVKERFGFTDLPQSVFQSKKSIWVHSVSVGETLAAVPLIRQLQATYPHYNVVVTTMTPTGSDQVRSALGDTVFHAYIPYDLPGSVGRFIARIRPVMFIIMETELWPNAITLCQRANVKIVLANARLSEKSARGYKRIRILTQNMLQQFDCIAAQGEVDAGRFVRAGARQQSVHVAGNLKFDIDIPESADLDNTGIFHQVKQSSRPVFIAASTREGEEEKVLSAYIQCLKKEPSLLMVLVPRHPERFNLVTRLCEQQGLEVIRRSTVVDLKASSQILIGDSMGEMWSYYNLASIAYVGGSLVNTGCHNVLEPAALGLPVLVGPSQFNFALACKLLENSGALITVQNEDDLAREMLQLIQNSERRSAMGTAGQQVVAVNRGSLQRHVELIAVLLED